MKKINPIKTYLKAHSTSSLVIGSNPIFSTKDSLDYSGEAYLETLPQSLPSSASLQLLLKRQYAVLNISFYLQSKPIDRIQLGHLIWLTHLKYEYLPKLNYPVIKGLDILIKLCVIL